MEILKEREKLIYNPQLVTAEKIGGSAMPEIAAHYKETWETLGNLKIDPKVALQKISEFKKDQIFVLTDESGKIYAELFSTLLKIDSLWNFGSVYKTYAKIEEMAGKKPPKNPDLQVCFSLNCPKGFRVINDNGLEESMARFILSRVPTPQGARKLGYSFMPGVPKRISLYDHYMGRINEPKSLGAVGMHESFGGITIGFFESSRPEHEFGGRGNVPVLYPIDDQERQIFLSFKELRKNGHTELVSKGEVSFFKDVLEYSKINQIFSSPAF